MSPEKENDSIHMIPSISPARARKFEMALPKKSNLKGDSPSSNNRENRFKQNGDSNFMDFGKTPDSKMTNSSGLQEAGHKNGLAKSRFAAFANTEVGYVKEIHEEIQSVITEKAALNLEHGQNFASMDLARLLNKVIINLNLQPAKELLDHPSHSSNSQRHWVSNSPSEQQQPTLQELKSTINMQNVLMSELGKSMKKITKYNCDLVEYNKKLISEKTNAIQARDDLLMLLEQNERKEKKHDKRATEKITIAAATPHERQFFDEAAILDAAVEEFKKAQNSSHKPDYVSKYHRENNRIKKDENSLDTSTDPHAVQLGFSTDTKSIKYDAEYPSPLKVIPNLLLTEDISYSRTMKKNISKHHEVSNAHSAEFQRIVNQKTKYLGQLNAAAKNWNKKVIEADSTEEYSTLLEIKIKELSTSFEEVVKVLAKSQSSSRAWKLKFEAAKTALASLKLQNKKQQHTYSGKTPLLFQPLRSRKEEKPWTFSLPPGRDSKTAYIPNLINRNSELLL